MFHQNLLQSGERIFLLQNFTTRTKQYIFDCWANNEHSAKVLSCLDKISLQIIIYYQINSNIAYKKSRNCLVKKFYMIYYFSSVISLHFLNVMSNEPWIKQSCFSYRYISTIFLLILLQKNWTKQFLKIKSVIKTSLCYNS